MKRTRIKALACLLQSSMCERLSWGGVDAADRAQHVGEERSQAVGLATTSNVESMFLNHYGLREQPFGVTPDVRFLYFSPSHREALASLYYGLETGRAFLLLLGQPGIGKTTLLLQLLERLCGSAHTVFLFQTQCTSRELLRYVLVDLGIKASERDLVSINEQLKKVLLEAWRKKKRVVLIIDEAQGLEGAALELVRLLSNFETPHSKLMQIVLAGQPTLARKLGDSTLDSLRQRISIVSRLQPFGPAETSCYVDHRLRVAGYTGKPLFTRDALTLLAENGRGIPRIINNLCFSALSLGYAQGQQVIDGSIIEQATEDLDLEGPGYERPADAPPSVASPVEAVSVMPETEAAVQLDAAAACFQAPFRPLDQPQLSRVSGFRARVLPLAWLGLLTVAVFSFALAGFERRSIPTLTAREDGSGKALSDGRWLNQSQERAFQQFLDRVCTKASRGVRELGKDIRELAGLLQGGEAVDSPQEPPTSPGGDPNSAQRRTGHDDEQTATKP